MVIGDRREQVIELQNDTLRVAFPEVHPKATCTVSFQRTLRVPDDNQDYPLPQGLGRFPISAVDDFDMPAAWQRHGGVFFPMYQSEAMWINFTSQGYPFAVKVAAGKINAVTGESWSNTLSPDSQDYVVIPEQRWLDGFSASKDVVRQFVAMQLGDGVTVEEQLTGVGEWGGLQLIFYPLRSDEYRRRYEKPIHDLGDMGMLYLEVFGSAPEGAFNMGLAAGGRIKQEIAKDPFGHSAWDTSVSSRCFVHLLNSEIYRKVTRADPPHKPLTAKEYTKAGIPWFDYYLNGETLSGSAVLAKLDGVAGALLKAGKKLDDNKPLHIASTVDLSTTAKVIRDGGF
jgi:hypothetical protein